MALLKPKGDMMAKSRAGSSEPCVSVDEFETMKRRFQDVGDGLTDQQLLELADCFHEILRWRRDVRRRHAPSAGARAPSEVIGDLEIVTARSTARKWNDAFHAIIAGAGSRPPS